MRKSYWYLTLMGIVSLVVVAMPVFAGPSELEEDHELFMEFETPHTDWAQPYALGKVPLFLANDRITDAYRVNAGRAICLPERPQIAYRPGWEVDYDYWVERVGRAVLWAAGKSPRVNLTIDCNAQQIDCAESPGHAIELQWEGRTLPEAYRWTYDCAAVTGQSLTYSRHRKAQVAIHSAAATARSLGLSTHRRPTMH